MEYAIYTLAVSAILTAIILANINRRASWAEGVKFARAIAGAEANRLRVLYNHAYEEGNDAHCVNLNGQVNIMRSLENRLEYELMARFMSREDPSLED